MSITRRTSSAEVVRPVWATEGVADGERIHRHPLSWFGGDRGVTLHWASATRWQRLPGWRWRRGVFGCRTVVHGRHRWCVKVFFCVRAALMQSEEASILARRTMTWRFALDALPSSFLPPPSSSSPPSQPQAHRKRSHIWTKGRVCSRNHFRAFFFGNRLRCACLLSMPTCFHLRNHFLAATFLCPAWDPESILRALRALNQKESGEMPLCWAWGLKRRPYTHRRRTTWNASDNPRNYDASPRLPLQVEILYVRFAPRRRTRPPLTSGYYQEFHPENTETLGGTEGSRVGGASLEWGTASQLDNTVAPVAPTQQHRPLSTTLMETQNPPQRKQPDAELTRLFGQKCSAHARYVEGRATGASNTLDLEGEKRGEFIPTINARQVTKTPTSIFIRT